MIASVRYKDHKPVVVYVWCQGCKHCHGFPVSKVYYEGSSIYGPNHHKPIWTFNGNAEKPSFSPSLREFYTHPETKKEITTCHSIITDGRIQFCSDCEHELKGQTLPLEEIPNGYGLPFDDS